MFYNPTERAFPSSVLDGLLFRMASATQKLTTKSALLLNIEHSLAYTHCNRWSILGTFSQKALKGKGWFLLPATAVVRNAIRGVPTIYSDFLWSCRL